MQCVSIFQKAHETLGQTSKQCRKKGAEGGKEIEVTEVGADEVGESIGVSFHSFLGGL